MLFTRSSQTTKIEKDRMGWGKSEKPFASSVLVAFME
jgi:hypothetical protein